jgi:hypothetical protein
VAPAGKGLSPAEIAAVLGCLAVTARGRLHRARRRFREVFEEIRAGEDEDRPRSEVSTASTGSVHSVHSVHSLP